MKALHDAALAMAIATFPDERLTFQKSIPTFHPESADDAQRFITSANSARRLLFITGFGNNIDPVGERFASVVAVRSDRLNSLISIEPPALRMEVQSGFPLREINAKLAPSGYFFPLGDLPYVGSVGGALAVGLSAQRGVASSVAGAIDGSAKIADSSPSSKTIDFARYVLGLTVVMPTGEIKQYGTPQSKSASDGDVARIMSPSWGLFGFIVSAVLRIIPISARDEYLDIAQCAVDQDTFLKELAEPSSYLAKVRASFDPNGIFPIIRGKD